MACSQGSNGKVLITKLHYMKKTDFLLEDFKNIQELIKFIDQKAALILVVCSILLSVFIEISRKLSLSSIDTLKNNGNLLNGILTFTLGVAFIFMIVIIFYLCIFHILKPKFAKHYNLMDSSLFYFEHIANKEKKAFKIDIEKLNENLMFDNISDQIFETSKILYKKSKSCALTMNILFATILNLLLFIFFAYIM
ncbi:MAG: hypothetical protein ACFFD1_10865 [Candidatus Thorarchaeota archaeon]